MSPFLVTVSYAGLNLITLGMAALVLTFYPSVSPFLIFIPAIIITSWYAGFLSGVVTAIISIMSLVALLFLPTDKPILVIEYVFFIELALFVILSLFASFVIDKAKNQEDIINYQKRLRQNKHIIETLENNYEKAQKEIQARDQFLAIASHELKTPVTSMILQVQTAIHNIRNVSLANFSVENLLKMLEGTEQQSQRLSKMVNDLLNLSLITTGRLDLEPEQIDLSGITKHVVDNFAEKLQRENNAVLVVAEKPVIGMWDKVRITQAVTNLLSNAIKYGDNKPITITVTESDGKGKIVVSDNGIGISHDQQERIFERFERAVTSREYQGLGVGLYITNQIVKAHKGRISVESKPHGGTSFIIELPQRIKN